MLLELFHSNRADAAVLMTGDTDLIPALLAARRMYNGKPICVAFPYRRMNNNLKKNADHYFNIRAHQYARHQFPNPIVCKDGSEICRPDTWL